MSDLSSCRRGQNGDPQWQFLERLCAVERIVHVGLQVGQFDLISVANQHLHGQTHLDLEVVGDQTRSSSHRLVIFLFGSIVSFLGTVSGLGRIVAPSLIWVVVVLRFKSSPSVFLSVYLKITLHIAPERQG